MAPEVGSVLQAEAVPVWQLPVPGRQMDALATAEREALLLLWIPFSSQGRK